MNKEQILDYMTLYGIAISIVALVGFLWPRYGYSAYPHGRYRLSNNDYKVGPLGIDMTLGQFRLIGIGYAAIVLALSIGCQFIPV